MQALKPAPSRWSCAPSGDDREWFDRLLRSVRPGQRNAAGERIPFAALILRMMRGERSRGSQFMRRADQPSSVVVQRTAMR